MDQTNSNNHQPGNMSNDFYSFSQQTDNDSKKKTKAVRITICAQVTGVALFCLGLVVGLLIGIYGFNGTPKNEVTQGSSSPTQSLVVGQKERENDQMKSSQKVPNTFDKHDHSPSHAPRDSKKVPNSTRDSHGHSHGPADSHGSRHTHADAHAHDHPHSHPSLDDILNSPNVEATLPSTDTGIPKPIEPEVTCAPCRWTNPIDEVTRPELFSPINSTEMVKARDALYRDGIITVKPGQELGLNESYVQSMYLFPPDKAAALAYLDHDGPFPGRYVTAMVIEGAKKEPQLMKYKVGPLEGDVENMKITPLLKTNEVPFSHRPFDAVETREVILTVMSELFRINPMMQECFDSRSPYKDMSVNPNGPFIYNGERTSRWTAGLRGIGDKDFDYLNVLPLNGFIYHGGQNFSEWRVYNIFFLNQGPFDSVDELYKAYNTTDLFKIRYPKGTRELIKEITFPKRHPSQPVRPHSERAGAQTVEPTGPRYRLRGHTISWLGWDFSVTTSQHRGPAVFNVKFRGERVVYENALNDIGLLYSADGTGQDNIFYTDSTFGLGGSKAAISDIDCPAHASYIKSVMWSPWGMRGSELLTICIFEVDAQEPIYRHKGEDIEVGMRNRYLVARYPTQVGNYDYLIDFQFHLDGKIVTTATATGFIQASYYSTISQFYDPENPGRTPFGFKVSNDIIGPIHDHTFAFKVDLDVVNEKNDFQLIHWKYGDVMDALKTIKKENATFPGYFFHNKTRYVEWEHVKNETEIDIDSKNPKFWTFINNNVKNFWDVSRGYRLVPMHSGTQNIQSDHPEYQHLSFTEHHLTVTKRKENEQYIKPIYNPADPTDPEPSRKYVKDMVDGESIENTDIVAWVALGFLHIPTSEDVPMTTKVTSGFTLKPLNFFDTTAVFDLQSHAVGANKTVFDEEPAEAPCQFHTLSVRG